MSDRLGLVAASLALCSSFALLASAPETDDESLDAQPFVDGVAKDTQGDAFRVVLTSRDGALEVGENALLVRVGFHDPEDPLAPGVGIPEARVQLSAWMPLDEGSSEAVSLHYAGDGQYLLDPVELDRPGIWQLDLEVDVGATMRENVSFTFLVEG